MYKRKLELNNIIKRKSLFLFGPRQTGKSTLLKNLYPNSLLINLLSATEFMAYTKDPSLLSENVNYYVSQSPDNYLIIIDEIQKIPILLDEVHLLIESNKKIRFILTGSSSRKLKRAGVNLLGGRASLRKLFTLCYSELGMEKPRWGESLVKGGLPAIFDSSNYYADLKDYIALYMKEEIKDEGLVRNLETYSAFLEVAALTNSQQINYTKIANDLQIKPYLVKEYFQIIEDTLLGHTLQPFTKTIKRKAVATPKFYLFDCGVTNSILKRKDVPIGTPEYGILLEQAIFIELKAYLHYTDSEYELFYWRSTSQLEIDFILTDKKTYIGIEVKASQNPTPKSYRGFVAFEEDIKLNKKIVVCRSRSPRIVDGNIEVLPILEFLEKLWQNNIV
jgi:predicted AAA+ superfamily ATPase